MWGALAFRAYLAGRDSLVRLGFELRWYHQPALVAFSLLLATATIAALLVALLLLLSLVGLAVRIISHPWMKHDRR
jgi:hypothetical protein